MPKRGARGLRAGEDWFAAYLDEITNALDHASRVVPARAYRTGLLLPGDRKTVEPIAACVEPGRAQAAHHFEGRVVG